MYVKQSCRCHVVSQIFFTISPRPSRPMCIILFSFFLPRIFNSVPFSFLFCLLEVKERFGCATSIHFMEDEGDDDIVERLASATKGDERRGVVVPSQGGWGVSRDEGVRSEAMRNSVNVYKGGWVERRRYYVGEYGEMEKREAAINTSTRRTMSTTAVSFDGIGFMWGRGEVRWSRRVSGNQAWREWAEAKSIQIQNEWFFSSLARSVYKYTVNEKAVAVNFVLSRESVYDFSF